MAWWNRTTSGTGSGAGGGWRRTGDSDWKKAQDENDLLRQVSKQSGRRRSGAEISRDQGKLAAAKAEAAKRERKEAAKLQRQARDAARAARNLPGSRPSQRPGGGLGGGVKAKRGSSKSPLSSGGSSRGSGRSPLSGGGGKSGGGRKGGSPRGKRLY